MKQTAVEWLVEKLSYETSDGTIISHHFIINKLFEQAKEMEKEQKGYSEEEVRLAYFQGEKDSYVKGGQTKEMENEFIESLKNKLNK